MIPTEPRTSTDLLAKLRRADEVMKAIDDQVDAGLLNSRSRIADRRLEYGNPYEYEFSEQVAEAYARAAAPQTVDRKPSREEIDKLANLLRDAAKTAWHDPGEVPYWTIGLCAWNYFRPVGESPAAAPQNEPLSDQQPTPAPWYILDIGDRKFIAAKPTEDHPYFGKTRNIDIAGDEDYPRKNADMELICKLRNAAAPAAPLPHTYKSGHSRCQRCGLHKTYWKDSPECLLEEEKEERKKE